MDRRSALKKLGVGGAVAISTPVLLDSFNAASAASPYPTALDLQGAVNASWSPNQKTYTISNIAQLFATNTSFQWTDGSVTPPDLVFTPSTAANTAITSPTSGSSGQFEDLQFAGILSVDGNAKSYNFFWPGLGGPLQIS